MLEISRQRERFGRKAERELASSTKDHRTLTNIKNPRRPGGPKTAVGHTRRSYPRMYSNRTWN